MDSVRFRFGLFEFDPASQELRRNGSLVRLAAQPAQVLTCLLQNAGQVVSREQLKTALWDSQTFVEFEQGLNFSISQLRSTLRDNASEPIYVRTIPKKGYQFLAPVERVAETEVRISQPPAPGLRITPRMKVLATAIVLLVLVGLSLYWRALLQPKPIIAVLRFDNETGIAHADELSDALTQNIVERLAATSNRRYGVIGNARILRVASNQRDLIAIGESLHAKYVILGQLQNDRGNVRLLAHLIRLPEQTHLWVVRIERPGPNPSAIGLDVADRIASEFSARVIQDSNSRFSSFFQRN